MSTAPANRQPQAIAEAAEPLRLCVVLPALNESATLGDVLSAIPARIEGVDEIVAVVVDDGATDETGRIAAEHGAAVIRHPSPRGVGAAVQSGIRWALESGADLVVNVDADGQFDPAHIPDLIAPLLRDEADFATCSRFKDPALVPKMPRVKRVGNAAVARIVSTLLGQRFFDVACGFRAYNRESLLTMNLFGTFTYTQETFIDLAFKGMRIVEVPLPVRGEREFGKSRVASSILRYARHTSRIILSTYKDYRPFAFFSFLALLAGLPGLGLATFFGAHFLATGTFRPHLWAGFSSGFLLMMALVFLLVAVAVESQARMRLTLERVLYYQKRRHLDGRRESDGR
jgi:glycosyltransferase involved in cell wall biosynthesis